MVVVSRIYVDMLVEHKASGEMIPRTLIWRDGRRFEIDEVLSFLFTSPAGTQEMFKSYLCRIKGQEREIHEDKGRWFVERRPK